MKIIICFFLYFIAMVCNPAFCKDNKTDGSIVLFSDAKYDVSKIYHSLDILGFIADNENQAYSIIKITEFPNKNESYKLFVTNDNKFQGFDLPEITGLDYLTLGKMGFDDKGKLIIPFLAGNVDRNLYLYKVYKGKIEHISETISDKDMVSAMYDSNTLFMVDKRGLIRFKENDSAEEAIENIKVESIKDVRRKGDVVYFIATNSYGDQLNLIKLNLHDSKQNSVIKLEIDKKDLNSDFEIVSISNGKLFISRNPLITPAYNPSSSIIEINLNTKEINYDFASEKATRVIDINLACTEKAPIPMVAYVLDNGTTHNLIVKLDRKELLLNPAKKELVYQVKAIYLNGTIQILSSYQKIEGRSSYTELSLIQQVVDVCSGERK